MVAKNDSDYQMRATSVFGQAEVESDIGLRERKKQQTRARIAAAAAEVFDDIGYQHARTADIAQRAEVSEATLFRYYPTKADLAVAHVRWASAQLLAGLCSRPHNETPYQACLAAAIPEAVSVLAPHRPERILRLLENDDLAARTFLAILEASEQVASDFAGRLRQPSDTAQVRVLANAAVGVVTTTLREWVDGQGAVDVLAIFRRHIEILRPILDVGPHATATTKDSYPDSGELS